ncbi:hypothetical protein [Ectobacillus sp. sgz5001026]|uniref:hypothetical protein n=1 Tax=Ectobacillus sp. sgz5001026 TaxID=3242473 RepID=UPI0036D32B36
MKWIQSSKEICGNERARIVPREGEKGSLLLFFEADTCLVPFSRGSSFYTLISYLEMQYPYSRNIDNRKHKAVN